MAVKRRDRKAPGRVGGGAGGGFSGGGGRGGGGGCWLQEVVRSPTQRMVRAVVCARSGQAHC